MRQAIRSHGDGRGTAAGAGSSIAGAGSFGCGCVYGDGNMDSTGSSDRMVPTVDILTGSGSGQRGSSGRPTATFGHGRGSAVGCGVVRGRGTDDVELEGSTDVIST